MNGFLEIMEDLAEFEELLDALKRENSPINVIGVSDSVRAHLIFATCEKLGKHALVVAENAVNARQIYEDMNFFVEDTEEVLYFTDTDLLFYDVEAKGQDVRKMRLKVLDKLYTSHGKCHVITTIDALLSMTASYDVYEKNAITITIGDEIELNDIAIKLSALGYKREEMVEGAGQFSIRGGILDFFPYYSDAAYRVEFFDTEVDSIRLFDIETQRTIEMTTFARVSPAREIMLNEEQRNKLIEKLTKILEKTDETQDIGRKLSISLRHDIERLKAGVVFPSLDKYIPLIYEEIPTLIDYISEDAIVFWNEPSRIKETCIATTERFNDAKIDMANRGILSEIKGEYSLSLKEGTNRLLKNLFVGIGAITHSGMLDYKPKALISLTMKSINSFQGRMEYLYETLKYYKENKYKTVIIAGSEARAKNLIRQLSDEEISADYAEVLKVLPPNGGVTVTHGSIQKGFEYPLIRTAIIGDREIFGGERKKRTRHLASKGDKLQSFTDLNQGDFIVHQNYGIGQYVGIEQLSVAGIRKDYLKINYKGDDVLYVPTDQLDMVYKHISKDGVRIKLNHLGGGDWTKTKQRVKAAAADMAKELIALYAERSQIKGIPFSKDSEWQKEFEESFPYDETDDQLRSIEEVKSDMEKPQPMDRLLCGDVGYGKTEVAIRAAFKAVTDGYQVAYLVPTTILASQHYNTFKQRMKDYPINISLMSRFCTPVQQKKTLKELAVGEVDILIGTHKILGKSVKFDKLGLLIIDEEQRFGVGHKEKIKEIRKEIDVLTLSATPIPRTLHMSLTGIRDMSIINQPPSERLPVATYVLEYNDDVVREAINREMGRGGQVYYLFNRVEGIYKAATKIAELVPDARVAVAHGRMNERELEEIMLEVSEGELDVLVCTTIIETGLDIPNVNTIIIEDADRLGLAQLYQLRGRVGRSNRLAYAYLTFRRDKVLSEIAEKRLLAIKEFTEFGSGFKIAMRDLEIRGTGNLIGAKQHGHMDAVGYDMYCRLLEEAVLEEQGIEKPKKTETLIDLPVSAYIPESYIPSHAQRISAYKRIAAINTADDLFDTYDEIEDRYGTVPNVTDALMKISLIKAYAENFGVSEMIATEDKVIFKFDENNIPDMRRCIDMLIKNPNDFHITNSSPPRMQYNLKREKTDVNGDKYLNSLKETMEKLTLC